MTLDEIGSYLAANISGATSLTLGTNLFLGRMPDSPDTAVALFEYAGAIPDHTMGGDGMPVVERGRIQAMTRAAGYSACRTLAQSVWNALEGITNETLSGVRYNRVSAIQSPFPIERDTSERLIVVQNFEVLKVP